MSIAWQRQLGNVMVLGAIAGFGLLAWMGIRNQQLSEPAPELWLETCCADGAGPRRAPLALVPKELSGGSRDEGQIFYGVACANCHDADGSGRRGRTRFTQVPDLRRSTASAEEQAAVVLRGRGEMPAFGGLIEEEELRDLLAFIEHSRRPGPAENTPETVDTIPR